MFKSATVRSGDVPSTQTNFPSYVDLDRLGITTLAEAQSVRVYADEAKTTEWAREIVSVTEMHVKVPSLTSTVEIFVDWDGVRADYAVGATYGRNAVWSDYILVFHGEESSTTEVTDSVSGLVGTKRGANTPTEAAGQIGKAQSNTSPDSPSNFIIFNDSSINAWGNGDGTAQAWYKEPASGTRASGMLIDKRLASNRPLGLGLISGKAQAYIYDGSNFPFVIGSVDVQDTAWHHLHVVRDVSGNNIVYTDGVNVGSTTDTTRTNLSNSTQLTIFGRSADEGDAVNGFIDEVRLRNAVLTATWIETEYNNQNDEATFWGTWTDAGGGDGGGAAQAARRGAVMMM